MPPTEKARRPARPGAKLSGFGQQGDITLERAAFAAAEGESPVFG